MLAWAPLTLSRYSGKRRKIKLRCRYLEKVLGEGNWRRYLEKVLGEGTWRRYLEKVLGEGTWRRYLEKVLEVRGVSGFSCYTR